MFFKNKYPLALLHIPKVGGITLKNYLEETLNQDELISNCGNDDQLNEVKKNLEKLSSKEIKKIKYIFGHRVFKIFDIIQPKEIGCFFRNPISRAISHYNFHNQAYDEGTIIPSGKGKIIFKRRPTIEEVNEKKFLIKLIDMVEERAGYGSTGIVDGNFQCMALALFLNKNPKNVQENDVYQMIKKLDFIGIQEHMNLSLFFLNKFYDIPLKKVFNRNVSSQFKTSYLPTWFIKKCEEHFELDFLLYDLATRKFDDQYNKVMKKNKNFQEWVKYQKINL